ncbi:amidohydrolase family protein [soil metagenome]
MKPYSINLLVWLTVALNLFALPTINAQTNLLNQKNYQFSNGKWFDGKVFKRETFYSANGILTKRKPLKIDETVDLKNGFVISPFADAHTHNLDGVRDLERVSKAYLEEGTFYVQVLGNYASGAKQARLLLNKPSTLDVSYANGMLTCTYGHPFMVYEPFAMGIYNYPEALRRVEEVKKSRRAENNAYWFLDTKTDVDEKWEKILAAQPDIIKIGLLDAENYAKYAAADDKLNKGLSPEVAEYVVRKAHQAGLRVYAHIETANDFRLGVRIGVDGFAHAPHYSWDGKTESRPQNDLTVKDIKLAARKKVVVIPTSQRELYKVTDYDSGGKGTLNQESFGRVLERQKKLFNQMHKSGVRLAFGLDSYGSTVSPEIWHFHDNKIFDNQTLLKIAVETTAQTIFPNRKIGRLREGYEASFLVLNGNPLEDFRQIKNINLRFKQGFFINMK